MRYYKYDYMKYYLTGLNEGMGRKLSEHHLTGSDKVRHERTPMQTSERKNAASVLFLLDFMQLAIPGISGEIGEDNSHMTVLHYLVM